MKINQLFKTPIPEELLINLLKCFGYDDLNFNEERSFCKFDLDRLRTIEKVSQLKDEISKYYLPCKSKVYLSSLDDKKCITILRQILRLYNYTLLSKQKYIKQKKTTFYVVQKKTNEHGIMHPILKIDNEKTVITFT